MTPEPPSLLLADGPLIDGADLEATVGWEQKPEGLCRGDECVIVPDRGALEPGDDGRVDMTVVAELLDRPVAVDGESGTVAIGARREHRRRAIDGLIAPDFVLPDLDGTPHALSDHRSKKRLLVAFASW